MCIEVGFLGGKERRKKQWREWGGAGFFLYKKRESRTRGREVFIRKRRKSREKRELKNWKKGDRKYWVFSILIDWYDWRKIKKIYNKKTIWRTGISKQKEVERQPLEPFLAFRWRRQHSTAGCYTSCHLELWHNMQLTEDEP